MNVPKDSPAWWRVYFFNQQWRPSYVRVRRENVEFVDQQIEVDVEMRERRGMQ